ncbi:MAG: 50S ribosomal protein L9 [Armatimonadetes bacterium]|nr:50S ribosomal protein L9 [Armatimonadota bacterium]
MKVILMQDIADQGKQGDIVNVSDGYARNYLFPRKLAVEAAGGALKNLQTKHALEERRAEKLLQTAEKAAEQLRDKTVTLPVRAGENNRLYGRVTAADIAEAARKGLGVTLDKRKVGLIDPIKSVGEYEVPIKLHRDVTVPLKVAVVAQS